jgi:hypothetical protein
MVRRIKLMLLCYLAGYGVRVATSSGRLVISDGIGRPRRTRRFDKATHGLSRVVVLATCGAVTIDALNWCRGLGTTGMPTVHPCNRLNVKMTGE